MILDIGVQVGDLGQHLFVVDVIVIGQLLNLLVISSEQLSEMHFHSLPHVLLQLNEAVIGVCHSTHRLISKHFLVSLQVPYVLWQPHELTCMVQTNQSLHCQMLVHQILPQRLYFLINLSPNAIHQLLGVH